MIAAQKRVSASASAPRGRPDGQQAQDQQDERRAHEHQQARRFRHRRFNETPGWHWRQERRSVADAPNHQTGRASSPSAAQAAADQPGHDRAAARRHWRGWRHIGEPPVQLGWGSAATTIGRRLAVRDRVPGMARGTVPVVRRTRCPHVVQRARCPHVVQRARCPRDMVRRAAPPGQSGTDRIRDRLARPAQSRAPGTGAEFANWLRAAVSASVLRADPALDPSQ